MLFIAPSLVIVDRQDRRFDTADALERSDAL